MNTGTFIALALAALVIALASSYMLWFGPAARKPIVEEMKDQLEGEDEISDKAEDADNADEDTSEEGNEKKDDELIT